MRLKPAVGKKRKSSARASTGIDISLGKTLKECLPALARPTHGPRVVGGIGAFGGLFRAGLTGMKDPVLVASMDGVGTKLNVAVLAGRHNTVGEDLVNHCVNDIAAMGARPLFFLDYFGAAKLESCVFRAIVSGLVRGCRRAGCALLGGETAQMPGLYHGRDYDLVGCIVGVVERARVLDGSRVRAGDKLIALPSNGLHTNGYTLARRVLLGEMKLRVTDRLPGSRRTVAAELLRVHRNYEPALRSLSPRVLRAAAHITGGGLPENLPRALPAKLCAVIELKRLCVPRIFRLIAEKGRVSEDEMFRVFNMGVGMVLVVAPEDAAAAAKKIGGRIVGEVAKGPRGVQFI